ncbi:MAG: DNA polymerase III subunit gamma/tau [Anaeromusa sp.]|uniref:DNA polymerase III subunit gamma/tau n=1 Tax=Anaeromusa sp. TaxID=1872520 RepID=UPI002B221006|nr:DNA polymerase III subunit gamma/tau [Anaeromusa sp.]MEA4833805.1 DNA polymerase III subunit gamma/tau [Anaeromusa sp.]
MAYIALYRRWRPQDFDSLVGQEHIRVTLENAIRSDKIAHAYLFAGPRGTGKTSTAKIFAKALNCVQGPTLHPCNTCSSCVGITDGSSMDVVEVDAASNRGIDEIRDLRETVKFAPVEGKYKVYIIDEVHMLTTEAFNALLKTLEEPPSHVVFILATTEPHKIPATIHSRCQRYDFRRITQGDLLVRLQEVAAAGGMNVEEDALRLIAAQADGGMRDALSLLDQCASMAADGHVSEALVRNLLGLVGHEWVWSMTERLGKKDAAALLEGLEEMLSMGREAKQMAVEWAGYLRDVMLYQAAPGMEKWQDCSGSMREKLAEHAKQLSQSAIMQAVRRLGEAIQEARWAVDARIPLEMALLALCRGEAENGDWDGLVQRVQALETALAQGGAASPLRTAPEPSAPARRFEAQPEPVRRSAAPAMDKVTRATPPAATPSAVVVSAAKPTVAAAASPVSGDLWQQFLKRLMSSGKRSVYACVSQGQLVKAEAGVVMLQFTAAFPCERTAKDDYREIVENLFAELCGHPVQLQCVQGVAGAAPAAVKTTPTEPDWGNPALREAMKMFPGKVLPQEKKEDV